MIVRDFSTSEAAGAYVAQLIRHGYAQAKSVTAAPAVGEFVITATANGYGLTVTSNPTDIDRLVSGRWRP